MKSRLLATAAILSALVTMGASSVEARGLRLGLSLGLGLGAIAAMSAASQQQQQMEQRRRAQMYAEERAIRREQARKIGAAKAARAKIEKAEQIAAAKVAAAEKAAAAQRIAAAKAAAVPAATAAIATPTVPVAATPGPAPKYEAQNMKVQSEASIVADRAATAPVSEVETPSSRAGQPTGGSEGGFGRVASKCQTMAPAVGITIAEPCR